MACNKDHSDIQNLMATLPTDQGGKGRHKCAACAYELGFNAGYCLEETVRIGDVLNSLEESQAGAQRHKSPHAAYALGYYHGVNRRIKNDNGI